LKPQLGYPASINLSAGPSELLALGTRIAQAMALPDHLSKSE